MLAIACSPRVTDSPTTESATPAPSPSITSPSVTEPDLTPLSEALIERLKTELGQELKVATDQVQLQHASEVEWGDACLGLPQTDELCAQVVTPGYQAVFATPQGTYQVHSDRTGKSVRITQVS